MTSFNTLFNRMFQEKSKSVYLIFLIQAFASLCLTIIVFVSGNGTPEFVNGNDTSNVNLVVAFLAVFAVMMLITSFVADFVYWIVSSIKNEKINRSQTWRLIPVSDTKFLLGNFGTAFLTYIWLGILETVTILITLLPMLSDQEVRKVLSHVSLNLSAHDWQEMLASLGLIILIGYAWYAIVSLLNLASRSIIDFLPGGSSKVLTFIIRVVVIIAIIWILGHAASIIFSVLGEFSPFAVNNYDIDYATTLLQFLVFDVVITLIDIFLLNKFVEAKQN
ncbi:ABC transporter permease [Lactobacillus crispatus]|uniref:ABC transporter permease n=1 Tax=Lactobacillus crispatus TaxID=47770 RepID=UPI000C7E0E51|nr:ABC transporter permease [Lactobacillus crispatus]KAA8789875.1 ABC transporter permease [Lactobacillus crispatus]KAA8789992.1 ABC transporter permease [Lactobacillus crispatus]MDK7320155.1 ABC transporter permease [Lactobacillus crispatus]MDK8272561.1 ABC transporter permease [Lactobacillus crispatus]MDK8568624.1 ABC transporter permease [Lactobacillus crispatus]